MQWMRDIEQARRMRERAWRQYNRCLEAHRKAAFYGNSDAAARYGKRAWQAKQHYDRRGARYVELLHSNAAPRRVLFVQREGVAA